MKVLIVDDSAEHLEQIAGLLNPGEEQNLPEEEKVYQIVRAKNKEEALSILKDSKYVFDIVLLDIKLNEKEVSNKDGLLIARVIMNSPNPIPIIFVTQNFDNHQYAKEAERYGIPLRYFLSKQAIGHNPYIFQKRIDDAIDDFGINDSNTQQYNYKKSRSIGIRMPKGEIKFFKRNEILYLQTYEANKTRFVFVDHEETILSYHLGHFVPKIRSNYLNFIRIDQSMLVNTEMIDKLIGETLYFKNDHHIRISKAALARLRRENLIV